MSNTLPSSHVRAWYTYAFAAEVFAACGLAIFLPITLEQLAREVGYYAPGLTVPCSISSESGPDGESGICKARILGLWVDTASFSMYTKSLAVAIQAICIISIGPLADSPYWRKRLLITFAYIGTSSAILFLLFPDSTSSSAKVISLPLIAALLFIVGNTAYATSIVCYNAFLPVLAREDEDVRLAYKESLNCEHRSRRERSIEPDNHINDGEDGESHGNGHGSSWDGGETYHPARHTRSSLENEGRHSFDPLPEILVPAIKAISTTDLAESDPLERPRDQHQRYEGGQDPDHRYDDGFGEISGEQSSSSLSKGSSHAAKAETHYKTLLSLTTSRLSSIGTAIGFLSGVSVLALLLIPVLMLDGSTFSLRLAIGLSGIWWGLFTIPAWIGLPGRAGSYSRANTTNPQPSLDVEVDSQDRDKFKGFGDAWRTIGRMIKPRQMRRLPNLYKFLLAWMFLSDGFHTTTYSAILFASSVLSMSPAKIILIGILVQLSAVFSSILTPRLQRFLSAPLSSSHHVKGPREDQEGLIEGGGRGRGRVTNFKVLLGTVLAACVIPLYTTVGLFLPIGGLRTEGEMYVLAVWFGLVFGPFLSYSRAVYTELIPPGHESTFFSLFAFTDKSASFIGPFIVGLIADLTGNLRLGFVFLLIMLVVPIPVLLSVSVSEGIEEAALWAKEEDGKAGLRPQEGQEGNGEERIGLLRSQT